MTTLTHKSPLGALEIPTVLGVVEPGTAFEVDFDIAAGLILQRGVFTLVGGYKALTVAELTELADRRQLEAVGNKKADIIAALTAADIEEFGTDEKGGIAVTSIQADCSIGFKKETVYGTAVTVDRFLEHNSETLDYEREFYQGTGMRPGSRLARSGRRVLAKDGGAGDIELEVPSRGLGTFLEALLGTAGSAQVAGALYQQLFTLQKTDFLPSLTIQKGIPRLGADTVDAYTFKGSVNKSFEFSMGNAEVLKLKSSWHAREVDTGVTYATPSYPTGIELFSFASASLVVGGTVVVPTTTALATGGTSVANVRDCTLSVDQKLDDNGWNMGSSGKRSRRGAVQIAEVKGKMTAEYDATTFRDALRDQSSLALVATFSAATDITTSNKPTLQIVIPDIRFEGELPKSNAGDVITQSIDFTGFDGLVAAHAMYIAVRTADTAL